MRIRPGKNARCRRRVDEARPRFPARSAWRPFALACTLALIGAPPCAGATPHAARDAGATPHPATHAGAAPALRDIEFAYSRDRDRWPASRTIAFSCAQCVLTPGQAGADRHDLTAGRDDARAGAAALLETRRPVRDGERGSSWKVLLGAHLASVAADTYTTRRALDSGASEANPMYAWAGDGGGLAARLAVGGGVTWLLHRLHRDHPGLARALTVAAIFANLATSWSNDRLARSNDSLSPR